jgi:hypothetical protein
LIERNSYDHAYVNHPLTLGLCQPYVSWIQKPLDLPHHKFSMQWINNENRAKFVHSNVPTFYTQISCIENRFDTWINMLTDEIRTYEWTNVTRISHLSINSCVKYVFNAQYQCMKHMNYEWINVTWFPFLIHDLLSLWCKWGVPIVIEDPLVYFAMAHLQ